MERFGKARMDSSLKYLCYRLQKLCSDILHRVTEKVHTSLRIFLARVRKLSRPSVQINVAAEGGRQLNVA
jgi:hypothetical protein